MIKNNYILEGFQTTEKPLVSDLKTELQYLTNKSSDYLLLTRGEDFIQCIRHHRVKKYFSVEAKIQNSTNNELYRYKEPISLTRTTKFFSNFLKDGKIEINDSWEVSKLDDLKTKKSTKSTIIILSIVSIIILVGVSFAANASNRPWYEGFITGLIAISYIAITVFVFSIYFKNVNKKITRKSVEIGMPCYINYGFGLRIKLIDKKKKDNKKLAKLKLMLFSYLVIGVFIMILILSAFIGIFYLLQIFF